MTRRRVFLARHGNRRDFVDPTWIETAREPYDPPLSEDGVEQARRLGQRLRREGIDVIVTSPFLRTIQTAHHANEALGVPIYVEPGFGEWLSPHSFERAPELTGLAALRLEYPALCDDGYASSAAPCYPENVDELCARAQRALCALLDRFAGTPLVVGHAASVAAMALIDDRVEHVDCPLCALFCLEHEHGGWSLTLSADVSHVGAELATFGLGQAHRTRPPRSRG